MRNSKMGCLIFGLLALFVLMFFNGGGDNTGTIELPSDVNESSSAGGMGEGDLSEIGPLDGDSGGLGSMGGDAADGVSLDLDGDGSNNGSSGSNNGSAGGGILEDEIDVQVSTVQYSVLDAENIGSTIYELDENDNEVPAVNADGEFVLVRLLIANSGEESLTYFGANMIDDRDQQYSYVADTLPYIVDEEACEVVTIEPGEERTCTMVYDVSENAGAIGLILTDLNLLGGEEAIVELTGLP